MCSDVEDGDEKCKPEGFDRQISFGLVKKLICFYTFYCFE